MGIPLRRCLLRLGTQQQVGMWGQPRCGFKYTLPLLRIAAMRKQDHNGRISSLQHGERAGRIRTNGNGIAGLLEHVTEYFAQAWLQVY